MKRGPYRVARLATLAFLFAAAPIVVGAGGQKPEKGSTKSLKLDHFWCYIVSSQTPNAAIQASLEDQFQTVVVSVGEPLQFCNPVQKTIEEVITPIEELNNHLTMYNLLNAAPLSAPRTFIATNQFGQAQFTVDKATIIMVPTQKNSMDFPTKLDHFLCYPVNGATIDQPASLTDQFQTRNVVITKPELF